MTVNSQVLPVPMLIGADLNCYHVAKAFHEAYGVCSFAWGRYETGATKASRIVNFSVVPTLAQDETFLKIVNDFADAHPETDGRRILIGCTDDYANLIARNKEKLQGRFFIPYSDVRLMDELQSKERFYRLCDEHGIPYPRTVIIHTRDEVSEAALSTETLGFSYPIIVKPANSVVYWKHPFDGMEKVYVAETPKQAQTILLHIFGSGYDDSVILQDKIPGDDSKMYVLTAYSDKDGKVRMMRLGHVLLEEKTPKGRGNHTAIITEKNLPLEEKLRVVLESLGYIGFSNFDIKYDERDGSYRAFEINLRQGRSNYYVTASGANIARLLTEDYLYNIPAPTVPDYAGEEIFWSYVPRGVVYRYVADRELIQKAKAMKRAGKYRSSFLYMEDLRGNPRRLFYVAAQMLNQYKKFRKYYK